MSISKIFIPNIACVLTNERYRTYQAGFLFCHLGHAPGWAFGVLGCPEGGGGVKIDYGLNMVLSNRRGLQAEQNASKVKLVTLGEVKSSNIITFVDFGYHVNCKDFYTNFCVCSHR